MPPLRRIPPPPTRFGPDSVQPKVVRQVRSPIAAPPTRYGADAGQRKPAASAAPPVGSIAGTPPPPTRFAARPVLAKAGAPTTRARVPPPPFMPLAGHAASPSGNRSPALQAKTDYAAPRRTIWTPPPFRPGLRPATIQRAAAFVEPVVGLRGRTIEQYKTLYKPGFFSAKNPGALLVQIHQDFAIGPAAVRILSQEAWEKEYAAVTGKKIDASGKLGGTTMGLDDVPIVFISNTVVERGMAQNSIAEILATLRHECHHARQINAKKMIYNGGDIREFEAHYLELLEYANARLELSSVRLNRTMTMANINADGMLTEALVARVASISSAVMVSEANLKVAFDNARAHFQNMDQHYKNQFPRVEAILDRIATMAYTRPDEERLSLGDAIAYTIDTPDYNDFLATTNRLRTT